MTNFHIPTVLGPTSVAVCGSSSLTAAQQFEVMDELYRENFLVWDMNNPGSDGAAFQPAYFHAFFRWLGEITLTGNFHSPCEMTAQPNLKVYKSVNKTFAYAGDTLTYVLSYRNYGAADANPVSIVDHLPSDLFYLSSTTTPSSAPAVGSNGTVVWNLGTVPGLHNTPGNTNLSSTEGAVTLVVTVNSAAATERICNTAEIYVGSSLDWTTNQYHPWQRRLDGFQTQLRGYRLPRLDDHQGGQSHHGRPGSPASPAVTSNQSAGFWIMGVARNGHPGVQRRLEPWIWSHAFLYPIAVGTYSP